MRALPGMAIGCWLVSGAFKYVSGKAMSQRHTNIIRGIGGQASRAAVIAGSPGMGCALAHGNSGAHRLTAYVVFPPEATGRLG